MVLGVEQSDLQLHVSHDRVRQCGALADVTLATDEYQRFTKPIYTFQSRCKRGYSMGLRLVHSLSIYCWEFIVQQGTGRPFRGLSFRYWNYTVADTIGNYDALG